MIFFRRVVSTEQGEKFARENGLMFLETSAMVDNNVEEAFGNVASRIMDKIKSGSIDVNIEEYGVKKAGKELLNFSEYDQLVKIPGGKKKKCKC